MISDCYRGDWGWGCHGRKRGSVQAVWQLMAASRLDCSSGAFEVSCLYLDTVAYNSWKDFRADFPFLYLRAPFLMLFCMSHTHKHTLYLYSHWTWAKDTRESIGLVTEKGKQYMSRVFLLHTVNKTGNPVSGFSWIRPMIQSSHWLETMFITLSWFTHAIHFIFSCVSSKYL